jgi:hypothetical protein
MQAMKGFFVHGRIRPEAHGVRNLMTKKERPLLAALVVLGL